jgi:uncharacterized protein YjiS (DUF1127 family)
MSAINKPLCAPKDGTFHNTATGPFRHVRAWLADAAERARQRRALRRLDANQLKDIGLTPDDVDRESYRPFWR